MGSSFRSNLPGIILGVVVVLMGIEIIYLIRQNRQLLQFINNPVPVHQTLERSVTVPPFSAPDLDGQMVTVGYGPEQPHRLLLWFSTTCPACEENLRFWDDLFQEYASEHIDVLGICTEDPADVRAMTEAYGLDFPVVSIDNLSVVEAYKGFGRPQTVLVGPEGLIRDVWPGSLSEDRRESVVTALKEINTLTGKGGDIQ